MQKSLIFLLLVVLILLSYIYFYKPIEKVRILRMKNDTIYKIQKKDDLVIQKAKMKIRKNQNLNTNEYIANLDTIISGDTINLSFYYPQNEIDLRIKKQIDTMQVIYTNYEEEASETWINTAIYSVASFLLGYTLSEGGK